MSMTEDSGPVSPVPRVERRDRFLSDLEISLRELADPWDIMSSSMQALGLRLAADQVTYAEIDDAGVYAIIERDWGNGSIASNIGRHRVDDFGSEFAADLRAGRVVAIDDVSTDPRTSSAEALATFESVSIAAFLNFPLVKGRRLQAVLAIHSSRPRVWQPGEIEIAEAVTQRTWTTVLRARAEKRLRDSEARQALLLRITERQRAAGSADAMMQAASEELGRHLRADRVGFFESDGGDMLRRTAGWTAGRLPLRREPFRGTDLGTRFFDVMRSGRTMGIEDSRLSELTVDSMFPAAGTLALIGSPIIRNGRWHAGLYVNQAETRAWSDEELTLVSKVAEQTWDAVERARSVAALASSEERLRLALQAGKLGDWELEFETGHAILSARHDEIFGYTGSATDWNYDVFLRHVVEEDREAVTRSFRQAIEARSAWTVECRIRRAGAGMRWIEVRGEPVSDGSGRLIRLLGIVADITERKQAEAALADRETRLQAITNSVDQMIWSTGADGLVDYCNQRWQDYTAVPAEQAAGDGWHALIHADDRSRVRAAWRQAVADGDSYHVEYRLRHRSGEHRWVLARAQPVRDDAGRALRWYGTFTDIQDIVEAREVLARSRLELEHIVEERTRERDRAWKFSQDLQAVVGSDGIITAASEAWRPILGWQPGEVVGRDYLDLVHPDDRSACTAAFVRAMAADLPGYEGRVRHKNGGYRWISWVAAPESGLIYASGRNITAEKEAEIELERTREQLRHSQKMEAIGQLTGGLAHDFNNLLSVITISLQMVQRNLAQGRLAESERHISASQRAARQAASLTHRLLAFARRQTFDSKPTDLDRLVTDMADLIRRTTGPSVELESAVTADLWTTLVDRNQLENALLNLCLNARDAMPDGGRLTIATGNELFDERTAARHGLQPGEYVSLCVTDTGTGMPAHVVERAFEPFFTTKPMGVGTGLGLSMVYGFARQSGGQAQIRSEPGKGTTICLHFPRHLGPEDAARAEQIAKPTAAQAGEMVLLVDDEPDLRQLLDELLQEMGFGVLAAVDGAAGLRLLQSDARIDLLVTDIGLPGSMNGRQLADAARAERPGLPVLLITGYAENAVMGRPYLEAGTRLLRKPFTKEDFAARIHSLRDGGERHRPDTAGGGG